ncbi:hypothetical protein [Dactylosporangium sp. CA-092794]|uniref:hypothetical protein n=1 Tax=Dactylosporangium sp. CA-092794 TaxID=3239929 RepID=UPI003D8BFE1A
MRRTASALLAATVAAATVVLATGQAAHAGMSAANLPRLSWAYVDSASPKTKVVDATVAPPVGTIAAAGKAHTYRSYFTYDLSSLKGQVVHTSYLYTNEDTVTDCSSATTIEVWRTAPVRDNTSWKNPPKELERLAQVNRGAGGYYCPGYLGIDMVAQLNAAIARHDKSITVEYRIAAAQEGDVHTGRTFEQPTLSSFSNHPPVASKPRLVNPDRPCGTPEKPSPAAAQAALTVDATDADAGDFVSVTYAVWPVDHPDQRRELGGGYGTVDLSQYDTGTVLGWQARGYDYTDYGAWSKTCYVVMDKQRPHPPAVASKLYPEGYVQSGGQGIKGRFRLDADGETDVIGFSWRDWSGRYGTVDAHHGSAVLEFTPDRSGPNDLYVRSIDAAGNYGDETDYRFWVAATAPWAGIDVAGVGLTSHISLRAAGQTTPASFGYLVEGGTETRVPAVDGKATGDIVFTEPGYLAVHVRSYAKNGKLIGEDVLHVQVSDAPDVQSAEFNLERSAIEGDTGSFTFRPRSNDVVAYAYDFGQGEQRIPAGADGSAVLSWTAEPAGWKYLRVQSVRADGGLSQENYYQFDVIDPHPTVYTSQLGTIADGPGLPLGFYLFSRLAGAYGFAYTLNDGPEQTADSFGGSADITVVPRLGDNTLVVRALLPDGKRSPSTTFTWQPDTAPIVTSDPDPGAMDHPTTLTFRSVLPNTKEFHYTINWGEVTGVVAAEPDGTATVQFTAHSNTSLSVAVRSVDTDGVESPERTRFWSLRTTHVDVYSSYSEYWTSGGLGVPGTVTFRTEYEPETTEFVYRLNDGPETSTPADPEAFGTTVTLIPDRNGLNTLTVRGRTATGELSLPTEFNFLVGALPYVTSQEYPRGTWSGGAGVEGRFEASGGLPGVTSFDFTFDDAAPITVQTDSQGHAAATWTPEAPATVHLLKVVGHTADGTPTETSYYDIYVSP